DPSVLDGGAGLRPHLPSTGELTLLWWTGVQASDLTNPPLGEVTLYGGRGCRSRTPRCTFCGGWGLRPLSHTLPLREVSLGGGCRPQTPPTLHWGADPLWWTGVQASDLTNPPL
ncbi:hypothetical protein NDU88_007493, partial [Pleurodeles waltl]